MRRISIAGLVVVLLAAVPARVFALLAWTLVATPLTAPVGQVTTFSLTATNLDPLTEIGCLEVDLPSSFVITAVGTPSASNGHPWLATLSGSAVIVNAKPGGGRLTDLESVTFTVTARPTQVGIFTWPNHAHRPQDCSKTEEPGTPLTVTVLPSATLAPTPTGTASASPRATPTPAGSTGPSPTPLTSPQPSPAASPGSSPGGLDPVAAPGASPPPGSPLPGVTATHPGGVPPEVDAGGGTPMRVGLPSSDDPAGDHVQVQLDGLLGMGSLWFVPAVGVSVPGLLVILWVALQGIGAVVWIPAVRRLSEEAGTKRRLRGRIR